MNITNAHVECFTKNLILKKNMSYLLLFLFVFSIVLKLFPTSEPNHWYGYQWGSAMKSKAHWQVAQAFASICMMVLYGVTFAFNWYLEANNLDIAWTLVLLAPGILIVYFLVENRLKSIKVKGELEENSQE